jgi:hypothetical protein
MTEFLPQLEESTFSSKTLCRAFRCCDSVVEIFSLREKYNSNFRGKRNAGKPEKRMVGSALSCVIDQAAQLLTAQKGKVKFFPLVKLRINIDTSHQ